MILQKNNKKMQLGGGLTTEIGYTPIGIPTNDVSNLVQPTGPINIPKEDVSMYNKFSGVIPNGLESDKLEYYNRVQKLKDEIMQGFSNNVSEEDYKTRIRELDFLTTSGASQLKEKEARFKELQNTANKAKGDVAYYEGKALVYDNLEKKYALVGTEEIAKKAITYKDGKKAPRYQLQTVGQALELRATNKDLHGLSGGIGDDVEQVLHSITGVGNAINNIRSAFKSVGYSKITDSDLVKIGGAETSDLASYLESIITNSPEKLVTKDVISKNMVKSNADQLESARKSLNNIISNSDKEALKGQALTEYMQKYSNVDNPPNVNDWIEARTNYYINDIMLSYLKEENLSGVGKPYNSGSKGGGSEQNTNTNPLKQSLQGATKTKETLSPKLLGDDDKKAPYFSLSVTTLPDDFLFQNVKEEGNIVRKNRGIATLSAGDLENNLILPVEDNTQLTDIESDILDNSALMPGRQSSVYHNVPVFKDSRDRWNIAWDLAKSPTYTEIVSKVVQEDPNMDMTTFRNRMSYELSKSNDPEILKIMGSSGNIQFRSVARYTLAVGVNAQPWNSEATKGRLKGKSYEKFFLGDKHKLSNDQSEMEKYGWTNKAKKAKELYEIPVYSVLRPYHELETLSNQFYKTDTSPVGEIIENIKSGQSQEGN